MRADPLLYCSTPSCGALVYLSESVRGSTIARNLTGRYCPRCAIDHGTLVQAEEDRLEELLRLAGLIGPVEVPRIAITRPRRVRHFEGQGTLW